MEPFPKRKKEENSQEPLTFNKPTQERRKNLTQKGFQGTFFFQNAKGKIRNN